MTYNGVECAYLVLLGIIFQHAKEAVTTVIDERGMFETAADLALWWSRHLEENTTRSKIYTSAVDDVSKEKSDWMVC